MPATAEPLTVESPTSQPELSAPARSSEAAGSLTPLPLWQSLAASNQAAGADQTTMVHLRGAALIGAAVPTQWGGLGATAPLLNDLITWVASANPSAAIVLFQHYAVCARIAEWADPVLAEQVLPRLATGTWLAASSWSETHAGANKQSLSTTATRLPDGSWRLSGTKAFTTGAGLADVYLVLAQSSAATAPTTAGGYGSSGQSFFLVEADNPGLRPDLRTELIGMHGSATGFVDLLDAVVSDQAQLGPLGQASSIIGRVRESGLTLGAVSVGIMSAAVAIFADHGARRGLADRPRFRELRVELEMQLEAARAIVALSGRRAGEPGGLTTLQSKVLASVSCENLCAQIQRSLGSAGFVAEHPLNRLAHDARAVGLMGPTNDLCRDILAAELTR
jgi:alkylation response protein AidB-like acyl-CoA dehydrogenase